MVIPATAAAVRVSACRAVRFFPGFPVHPGRGPAWPAQITMQIQTLEVVAEPC
jgi:hypothetical protein